MTDRPQPIGATVSYLDFSDLDGWADDDHAEADQAEKATAAIYLRWFRSASLLASVAS